jgi:hypothetical protein
MTQKTIRPLLLIGFATYITIGPSLAQSIEIAPTRELIKAVEEMPDVKEIYNPEFHFRKLGSLILYCVYASGGNGHFCQKIPDNLVRDTDKRVIGTCKSNPNSPISCRLW